MLIVYLKRNGCVTREMGFSGPHVNFPQSFPSKLNGQFKELGYYITVNGDAKGNSTNIANTRQSQSP